MNDTDRQLAMCLFLNLNLSPLDLKLETHSTDINLQENCENNSFARIRYEIHMQ